MLQFVCPETSINSSRYAHMEYKNTLIRLLVYLLSYGFVHLKFGTFSCNSEWCFKKDFLFLFLFFYFFLFLFLFFIFIFIFIFLLLR